MRIARKVTAGVFGPFRNIIGSFIGSFTLLRRTDSPCCIREHRYWCPLCWCDRKLVVDRHFAALAIVMIALILSKLLKNKYNSPEGNGKTKIKRIAVRLQRAWIGNMRQDKYEINVQNCLSNFK